jgi:hypothetical protein
MLYIDEYAEIKVNLFVISSLVAIITHMEEVKYLIFETGICCAVHPLHPLFPFPLSQGLGHESGGHGK